MKANMRSPTHITDSVGAQANGKGQQKYYTWLLVTTLDYNMQVEFDDLYPDLPHEMPYGRKQKIHKTMEQENEKEKRKLGNRVRQERGIK